MAISYKRLWKILIDKRMLKTDLRMGASLSTNVIANFSKEKDVSAGSLQNKQ